ncbi:ABC transporter substrate-binding protein [Stappia sp. TSB10GB4]|uniref:ABC transporter substrate-binding protein n=1 Tax=Stappia sp. TSB10GB4 TaxID=2003584 RepID=UPI001644BD4B|nr:extracellular solute-binding protein [Stappia sp. TSB10GB4]
MSSFALKAAAGAAALFASVSLTTLAVASDKLTIVTSYPADVTDVYKTAFEQAHPGVTVEVVNKATSAGVKFLKETTSNNSSDIFWASAPDAFEVLKADGLLEKYSPAVEGLPEKIGAYPINDPDGFYTGFALSGYGIMWNTRYAQSYGLEPARQWSDLTKAEYFGHVGISSPSRSGTTHLTIETILQGEGWEKGWEQIKWISGNSYTITERSFGVPDGVNTGSFGFGVVIDFFGFSSRSSGFPVDFVYPDVTALVPANVGIVTNAPNEENARKFVDFLLSTKGQELLLDPKIMRLPVNPEAYANAPEGFPNPFVGDTIKASVSFDSEASKAHYNAVNALFDSMITYRHKELTAAVKAIHEAEAAVGEGGSQEAKDLIKEARALVAWTPVDLETANDSAFAAIFTTKRQTADDKATGRQAEVEQEWDSRIVANYTKAVELAGKAKSMK